eukprot:TRINITY_DN16694_c0_g1_i2.p2 TRINITY_DN16694_c0_g1~~TRINITY_DN16694_c0_g1_i2.p2  ORF type:complete len:163 (+),score=35.09 TRINITY_DN16694_c0_g1_i2:374-862(+)
MIVGLGNDLVHVPRIMRLVRLYQDRFLARAFHPSEIKAYHDKRRQLQAYCGPRANTTNTTTANTDTPTPTPPSSCDLTPAYQYLAGRWAVKESVYKACAVRHRERMPFPSVHVRSSSETERQPSLHFEGESRRLIEELGVTHTHVSITHDGDYAFATVILEK